MFPVKVGQRTPTLKDTGSLTKIKEQALKTKVTTSTVRTQMTPTHMAKMTVTTIKSATTTTKIMRKVLVPHARVQSNDADVPEMMIRIGA